MSLDVTSKFQDAWRSAARGGAATRYTCPICGESSNASNVRVKLWEHAKKAHPDSPEVTGYTEGDDAKADFLAKAYVTLLSTRPRRNPTSACLARL